ncbi:MAG: response regulator transcription factor [Bryobacteraceae bacterium]|jgi:two-component system KDP operon response regulator KdpE
MNSKRVRVLVVDDEAAMRRALRSTLSAGGFMIEEARNGEEAVEVVGKGSIDLVLLDSNMPGMGGVEACRRIRALAPGAGIVMITIRDTEDDKIEALEAGADDYVTKPFLVRELVARLQAVLRRVRVEDAEGESVLRAGNLELDVQHRRLRRSGEEVRLSPTEFELLRYLMQHQDVAIEHARLLQAVWGPEYGQELEYLRAYVRLLRKKIEEDPTQPQYLVTEPWLGYRFRSPSNS